jgi:hypothetical protein
LGDIRDWGTPPNPWQEMSLLHLFVTLTAQAGCSKVV